MPARRDWSVYIPTGVVRSHKPSASAGDALLLMSTPMAPNWARALRWIV
jgi:hypothetical protein